MPEQVTLPLTIPPELGDREDRFRRDLVIAKGPIRGLQLRIVEHLGEALAWSVGDAIGEADESPIQPCVPEVRLRTLLKAGALPQPYVPSRDGITAV